MLKSLTGGTLVAALVLATGTSHAAAPGTAAAPAHAAAAGHAPTASQLRAEALHANVRCLVIGFSLIQQPDAEKQKFGTIISMYYFGKVDGLAPKADLESLLVEETKNLTPAVAETEAKRCGLELTERGTALTQVGERIQKREAAAQKAAADKAAAEKPTPDKAPDENAAPAQAPDGATTPAAPTLDPPK